MFRASCWLSSRNILAHEISEYEVHVSRIYHQPCIECTFLFFVECIQVQTPLDSITCKFKGQVVLYSYIILHKKGHVNSQVTSTDLLTYFLAFHACGCILVWKGHGVLLVKRFSMFDVFYVYTYISINV